MCVGGWVERLGVGFSSAYTIGDHEVARHTISNKNSYRSVLNYGAFAHVALAPTVC